MPNTMPVSNARATLKNSTGRLMLIAASCGNENSGSHFTMSFSKPFASATPMAAPANDSIRDSVSNCRRMRERAAPIAERTASSCWRAVPRANSKIETFPQPINSSKATAASRRYNVPPIRSTKWSFNPASVTWKCSGKWLGVCFANCSSSDWSSAFAAARVTPGLSRVMGKYVRAGSAVSLSGR